MAKFTDRNLRLKDNERVSFGDATDSNMWWDGSLLRLDTVVSGVDPTQNYHLATKYYVDAAVTSGSVASGTLAHAWLTGLNNDDHTQYVLSNGGRGFTSTVSGVTPVQDYHLTTKGYVDTLVSTASGAIVAQIPSLTGYATQSWVNSNFVDNSEMTVISGDIVAQIPTDYISDAEMTTISGDIVDQIITDHGSLTGLSDDDHTQYILVNGTRAFSNTISGVTPTENDHLATKGYVDSISQGLDWQDSVLAIVPIASGVEVTGNRYIASASGGGWTVDNIYEWNGSSWDETPVEEGFATWVETADALYVYSNSSWIQFGSTVTHNNLSGLQGGTSGQYYHLTQAEESALTGGGNASTYHIHDDRYYTEGEVDAISGAIVGQIPSLTGYATQSWVNSNFVDNSEMTTISGDIVNQIPTDYISDSEMTTISGDIINQIPTDYISDAEMTTISGDIVDQIITDHGGLTGLSDDDHTQYILVNGTRGFTSTVSGVTPTQDYHLATKSYVDQGGTDRHGRTTIANGVSYVDVSFSTIGTTNYTVNATLQNVVDSPPSVYAFIVSATTASGFRVTLMGDTDSANYSLNWSVIMD